MTTTTTTTGKSSPVKARQLTLRYGHCFALSSQLAMPFGFAFAFPFPSPFSFPAPLLSLSLPLAMPFPLAARPGYNFNRLPVGTFHFHHIYCSLLSLCSSHHDLSDFDLDFVFVALLPRFAIEHNTFTTVNRHKTVSCSSAAL